MNRKVLPTFVLVLVVLVLTVAPTAAGRYWCRADPIVSFNGTPVQLWVELPEEYQYLVNGPIDVKITTPTWVTAEVLFTDAGFNGYGEEISFETRRDAAQQAGDVGSWNDSYRGIVTSQPETFTVMYEVTVPLDRQLLKADFGTPTSAVPVRLRITDANGFEQVVGGSADGATIAVKVQGSY